MRPADLLATVLGGRPRPRLAVGGFAAAGDVVLLAGGVLLTRVSTRSAVSRSVNRAVTVARSVSRRASRSLTFVFSAPIWSNIVGDVAGMVVSSGFKSITRSILLASNTATRDLQRGNVSTGLVGGGSYSRRCPKSRRPRQSSFCWIRWRWKTGVTAMTGRGQSGLFDEVCTLLRPNRLIAAGPPVVPVTFLGAPDTTNRGPR